MKLATVFSLAAALVFHAVSAASSTIVAPAIDPANLDTATPVQVETISPTEALQAIREVSMPEGVTFTGSVQELNEPPSAITSTTKATADADADDHHAATIDAHDQHQESFRGGRHRHHHRSGWRRQFGGAFGPYRFGFSCRGRAGWAYPLSYWNSFGAGLYGSTCGLGVPLGELYYC
uniref:Uncharacterized protein n=1 Tax=Globisporangium ultimum (strain ATCC 200006 / CBS 805.95 / DAOM BR144) TaxID=431595 RepID=K3X746_GLOUD